MKKYAPYILILLILFGLFSPINPVLEIKKADAQVGAGIVAGKVAVATFNKGSEIKESLDVGNILIKIFQFFFYTIPGFIIWFLGYVFNFIIYLALGGDLYNNSFVLKTWAIVRDISNIFFILILLWVAIRIILDMGGGEAKRMVAWVLIMALLINFSMFFTKIVIDSSNILALVFYNKMGTIITNSEDKIRPYDSVNGETDLSSALIGKNSPTVVTDENTLTAAGKKFRAGSGDKMAATATLGAGFVLASLSTGGLLFFAVIFVFLMVIFAFLNRIIMLLFLIILSPFAFMSFAVPGLAKQKYIGWTDWLQRLITGAFFAPIFMFMLYLIFVLIKEGFQKTTLGDIASGAGYIEKLLGNIIGLGLVMLLVYIATKFAIKGAGKAGEITIGLAKSAAVAGLAVATAGAGAVATTAIGGAASKVLGNKALQAKAASGNFGARAQIGLAKWASKTSFNPAAAINKVTGLHIPSAPSIAGIKIEPLNTEGGYKGMVERKAKAYKEELELYRTTETDEEVETRTKKEQSDYDHDKSVAKEKTGYTAGSAQEKAWEAEYERTNGPRPDVHTTSKGYDSATIKKFQESLGKRLNWGVRDEGIEAFAKMMKKETDEMRKITDRLEENKKALENVHTLMESGVKDGVVSGNREGGFTVDTEGIEKKLSELAFIAKREELKLQEYIKQGLSDDDPKMTAAQETLFQNTIQINKFNKLRTAPKEERDLKKVIFEFGEKQSALIEKQKESGKPKEKEKEKEKDGEQSAPKAPAPTASTTSSGGGGGGGAPSGGGGH